MKNKPWKRKAKRMIGKCIKRHGYCLSDEHNVRHCKYVGYPCWAIGFKNNTIAAIPLELNFRRLEEEVKGMNKYRVYNSK